MTCDEISPSRNLIATESRSKSPSQAQSRSCWCSSTELGPFSKSYRRCVKCGTLVYQGEAPSEHVLDDSTDFYGRDYWFEYQAACLGFANIEKRAVIDIRERCIYWLEHLLQYKLPPTRVLELGCAHGGSVALMSWAGYDAIGVELSPWVVDYAKTTFGVQVLRGPVEDRKLHPESFDAVCMFDVLEHLADPVKTLAHLSRLLGPEGIFLVQTPEMPERAEYEEMIHNRDNRLKMLEEKAHLFLFSRKAVTQIFSELGFHCLAFFTPLFSHDMFFLASRRKLARNSQGRIEEALCSHPSGRMTLALLELYQDNKSLRQGSAWRQALPGQLSKLKRLFHLIKRGEFVLILSKIARLMSSRTRKNDYNV